MDLTDLSNERVPWAVGASIKEISENCGANPHDMCCVQRLEATLGAGKGEWDERKPRNHQKVVLG